MDVSGAYYGKHFTIYVNKTTMLCTLHWYSDSCQLFLSEVEKCVICGRIKGWLGAYVCLCAWVSLCVHMWVYMGMHVIGKSYLEGIENRDVVTVGKR